MNAAAKEAPVEQIRHIIEGALDDVRRSDLSGLGFTSNYGLEVYLRVMGREKVDTYHRKNL